MNPKKKEKEKQNRQRFQKKKLKRYFQKLFPLEMVKENIVERPCGDCQACCMAIAVHELHKPMWQECEHQCSNGCAIYGEHPESCKGYWCLWQHGVLKGEENRPDKLGVIFDLAVKSERMISAWELWENAIDSLKVKEIIDGLAMVYVVVIRRYKSDKRRLVGPPDLLGKGIVLQEED